jgi:hypothetical protein
VIGDSHRLKFRFVVAPALLLTLAACNGEWMDARERTAAANATVPVNYRAEIVAQMHTYLNDPTNVRDAYLSEPALRTIDGVGRYSVCVRYNARKSNGQYAGSKDSLVLFRYGRLDSVVDDIRGAQCKDAAYVPFSELQAMTR